MNRRDALRGLSGAAASFVGFQNMEGSAKGKKENRRENREPNLSSTDDILTILKPHEDLIQELVDRGVISSSSLQNVDPIRNYDPSADENTGISTTEITDSKVGMRTGVVRISEEHDGFVTNIYVLIDSGRSYSIVEYDQGDNDLIALDEYLDSVEIQSPDEVNDDLDIKSVTPCAEGWEYVGTDEDCTDELCDQGQDSDCYALNCEWYYYVKETYEEYECQECYQTPNGIECRTKTRREFKSAVCDGVDCCDNTGPGCGCSFSGCP